MADVGHGVATVSDLQIRGGGVVAVDTEELRGVAQRLRAVAAEVHELQVLAWAAAASASARPSEIPALESRWLAERVTALSVVPVELAGDLEWLAAVYEIIELRAELAAAEASGDHARASVLSAQVAVLLVEHPGVDAEADRLTTAGQWRVPGAMAEQFGALWLIPGIGFAAASTSVFLSWAVGLTGAGTVAPGGFTPPGATAGSVPATPRAPLALPFPGAPAPLAGSPLSVPGAPTTPAPMGAGRAPVVHSPQPTTPVASLAEAARRIPGGGDSRVRVETYSMPGGSTQYAVYIAGTQTLLGGEGDPFDMTSNLELYRGERSASLAAVEDALAQAGAQPGDVVHAFGHSQGGMLASALALDGVYDTRTLVTFGSPVEADVSSEVLSVGIRHLDDPVAALAGGGHPQPVGAPGSFVAERVGDPGGGPQDLTLAAHGIDRYTQTAAMVDASPDPRAQAFGQVWRSLAQADVVQVQEFGARRGSD